MKVSIYAILVSCLLLSQAAFAQPEKGSIMLGGTAGFNAYSYGDYSSSYVYLIPQVGYFFTDRLAVGALLNLEFFGGDNDGSWIGIGPYARYYFNESGPARFFGQAGIEFYNIDFGGNSDSFTNLGFNVGAGVDYFLNESVALEAMLNFNSNKDSDDDESSTNFGLNIGVAAGIGGGK
jgi:outer membrane protein